MDKPKKLEDFKVREIKIDNALLAQTKGGDDHVYDTNWQTKDPHAPNGWVSDCKKDTVPIV